MPVAHKIDDTTVALYEDVQNADARLYYIVTEHHATPTGEQIEAGTDAAGDMAFSAGSAVASVGANGPFMAERLRTGVSYSAFFTQNLSAYKGFYQGLINQIGALAFTRAGTQDGVDPAGDAYTASSDTPAYILSPMSGVLLQEAGFEGAGETTCAISAKAAGINAVMNNLCGQVVFYTRKLYSENETVTLFSMSSSTGSSVLAITTGAAGDTVSLIVGGQVATSAQITPAIGDRLDIRWKSSAASGTTLWVNGAKVNEAGYTAGLADGLTDIFIGSLPDGTQHAAITAELVRVVDADLTDLEIEAW